MTEDTSKQVTFKVGGQEISVEQWADIFYHVATVLRNTSVEPSKTRLHASLYLWLRDTGSATCRPLTERWRMNAQACDETIIEEMEKQANESI